ncbi:MAG: hypothetical protein WCO53_06360 [Deltaproteobacteria bacterium]
MKDKLDMIELGFIHNLPLANAPHHRETGFMADPVHAVGLQFITLASELP